MKLTVINGDEIRCYDSFTTNSERSTCSSDTYVTSSAKRYLIAEQIS